MMYVTTNIPDDLFDRLYKDNLTNHKKYRVLYKKGDFYTILDDNNNKRYMFEPFVIPVNEFNIPDNLFEV